MYSATLSRLYGADSYLCGYAVPVLWRQTASATLTASTASRTLCTRIVAAQVEFESNI